MAKADEVGRIGLWTQAKKGAGSPAFKGNVEVDGVKYSVSLWANKSDNAKAPQYTGAIESIKQEETND